MVEPAENRLFGLIGKNISYSFSESYFSKKFSKEYISNANYQNFDLASIEEFSKLSTIESLKGLNVTIPYKEVIISFLDDIDDVASQVGAVNTIHFKGGKKIGYNTDVIGFEKSIKPLLKPHHDKALILGTGGASKAINFVLKKLNIKVLKVSRNPRKGEISYLELGENLLKEYLLIINCTPLGTHPNTDRFPKIPYPLLTANHLLYDLIYNPSETKFLQLGRAQGATIKNGLEMLEIQAEASWQIWNS